MSVSTRWGSGPGQDSPQHFPADRADQTGLHSGSTSSNCCPSTEINQIITSSEVVLIKFYFDGHEIVFLLHVLDPLVGLALRVDHEGPPPGVCDNDSVIHRELVLGKSSYLPLADSNWFTQSVHQGKLFRALDPIDIARGLPVTDDGFPEQDQRCGTNTLFETKSNTFFVCS